MALVLLSQCEADALLEMPKYRLDKKCWDFPTLGGQLEVPLRSESAREEFTLDIGQKRIALTYKYQLRARQMIVLARLDFGARHRNPDDEEVDVPHLHRYREGYGDRWAYPVPPGLLTDPSNAFQCLQDFMSYYHVVEPPVFQGGLF